jgi:putative hydrolase of the HAD superfamily
MILIFDLDDTLYPERSYVESGFRAVSEWGEERFGWDRAASFRRMCEILAREGRGRVFDIWLREGRGHATRSLIAQSVHVYRHHDPRIALPEAHRLLLEQFAREGPIFLVTDGHKVVQAKKVAALELEPLFEKIYITHRYGRDSAKPSSRCFDLIRRRTDMDWADMLYVGDNPSKDFVTLNQLGMRTVRVLTGRHAHDTAMPGYEAGYRIDRLVELPALITGLRGNL